MAYNKTIWQNGVTPINATNLNKIENELETLDTTKQNNLVSGTNIKTIDSMSILGSGNISIIESGSNGAAKYVKFDDGTLIQYGIILINLTDSRYAGGLTYYSGSENVTLPQNFKDTNYTVTTNVMIANMNYFTNAYAAVNNVDKIDVSLINTDITDSRYVSFICVGRWK